MPEDFLNILKQQANGDAARLAELLDGACATMASILANCDPQARSQLLARITERLQPPPQVEPFPREKLSPELLDWARQQFTEEELLAGYLEVKATGGLQLEDFIDELDRETRGDE